MLFLLRFTDWKYVLMPPTNGGPHLRLSSPKGGGSTFTTCAPMSASIIVQIGPESIRERSTMKMSSSGRMGRNHNELDSSFPPTGRKRTRFPHLSHKFSHKRFQF